ncbi:MAG: FAD-dependent oxidoreductase [Myxococcaceae bacterium]|nr:MAG: FAD-dependent oxidoreductase [Myxococcaceae bacterium]
MPAPVITPSGLLDAMCVEPRLYVLGYRERRVTLYSQQVRALNLVYSLFAESHLKSGDAVAIVGGGVAGVTAAAAAAMLGCKVTVLEQRSHILHLQRGCLTRWIHPHIYDWPREGSEDPVAGLPVLDWKAGYADDVARQLLDAWNALRLQFPKHLDLYVKSKVSPLGQEHDGHRRLSWNTPSGFKTGNFQAVILALGFGIEQGLAVPATESSHSISYWRNDDLNQVSLEHSSERRRHFISGCGDGGLVDLLRTRLTDFRHEHLVNDVVRELGQTELETLRKALVDIEDAACHGDGSVQLYDAYQELPVPLKLDEVLRTRLREDTDAVLNGQGETPLNRESTVLNRFLVSRLLRMGVRYERGKIEKVTQEPALREPTYRIHFQGGRSTEESFHRVVVRHGPTPALLAFPEVAAKAEATLNAMAQRDQTRFPIWSERFFAPPRTAGTALSDATPPSRLLLPALQSLASKAALGHLRDTLPHDGHYRLGAMDVLTAFGVEPKSTEILISRILHDTSAIAELSPPQVDLFSDIATREKFGQSTTLSSLLRRWGEVGAMLNPPSVSADLSALKQKGLIRSSIEKLDFSSGGDSPSLTALGHSVHSVMEAVSGLDTKKP